MKKQIIILLFTLFSGITFAQNPIEWIVYKGGSGIENMGDLLITDSTYVICASSNSSNFDILTNNGLYDLWLFSVSKTNSQKVLPVSL